MTQNNTLTAERKIETATLASFYINGNGKELAAALQSCKLICKGKSTIPVLNNVRIEAKENGFLSLITTDLDNSVEITMVAAVEEPGIFTVPLADFLAAVKRAEKDFRVEARGRRVLEPAGAGWKIIEEREVKVNIEGQKSSLSLEGGSNIDFPEIPRYISSLGFQANLNTVEAESFKQIIGRAASCITSEQSRFTLNGVLLEIEGLGLRAVGCDGHRLAFVQTTGFEPRWKKEKIGAPSKTTPGAILRGDAIKPLQKLAKGSVKITLQGDHFFFWTDSNTVKFASRVLPGKFPSYEMVIPSDDKLAYTFQIDADDVFEAVKAAEPFFEGPHKKLAFQPHLNNLVFKTIGERVYKGRAFCLFDSGLGNGMALNGSYFLEALEHSRGGGVTTVKYNTFKDSCRIQGRTGKIEFNFIIMGIDLNGDRVKRGDDAYIKPEEFEMLSIEEKNELTGRKTPAPALQAAEPEPEPAAAEDYFGIPESVMYSLVARLNELQADLKGLPGAADFAARLGAIKADLEECQY